jgi:SAM-dependent methyltransferase
MLAWLYARSIDPLLVDTRSMIPGFAGMAAGNRVLDVCCGTGAQVKVYAAAGLDAVGIDICSSMIFRAVDSREGVQAAGYFYERIQPACLSRMGLSISSRYHSGSMISRNRSAARP